MSDTLFIDVLKDNVYRPYCEALYLDDVSSGTGGSQPYVDLTFSPNASITNGEMAVWVVRALKAKLEPTVTFDQTPPNLFSDVANTHSFYGHVQKFMKVGCNCGPSREAASPDYGPGLFLVSTSVKRKHMAEFIVQARRWELLNPTTATFPDDVPTTHPYFRYVETLYAHGVTVGTSSTTYGPDAAITRAQMAVFIVRAFELPFTIPANLAPTGS